MDIIVTRYIGIKGTAILANARYEELLTRYPNWLIDEAKRFADGIEDLYAAKNFEDISNEEDIILSEINIAFSKGAVYAKEYTEFGIFEALFQMSKELKTGLWTNIKDIPIKQETVEVSDFFKVDPYAMFSGVSAVIVIPSEKTVDLMEALNLADIPAVKIGETVPGNDKVVINEDERSFLKHIRKDELKNLLGRKEYYERTNLINS